MEAPLIQWWEAESFDGVFTNGRTKPLKLGVFRRDELGNKQRLEVITKSLGHPAITHWQLITELFGNLLAQHFHLNAPLPVLVNLSSPFVEAISKNLVFLTQSEGAVKLQAGPAVGCRFHKGIAPFSMPIKAELPSEQEWARLLFAFDMLVQNPDRRWNKHNAGLLNNEAIVYDFELCFSFVYPLIFIGGTPPAWKIDEHLAKEHLFFNALRGKIHNWQPFFERLSALDCDKMEQTISELLVVFPPGNNFAEKVLRHLRDVQSNSDLFRSELDRNLK